MKNSVIVLGAKGRFGSAAVEAFAKAGWKVTALARKWNGETLPNGVTRKTASAFEKEKLVDACHGHAVIVNAINPPYEKWADDLPTITQNVIAAGIATCATVMIPGNIYNYGNRLPANLTEETPHVPNTKKGRLRIEMEQAYQDAIKNGLRTIVLRAGDFIEGKNSGNWFEAYITNKLNKGAITYPGRLDAVHSWAYLPDMARAMVGLASKRKEFQPFETFGYRGFALTGNELVTSLERVTGQNLTLKNFPWPMVKIIALFSKPIWEVLEMRYLWNCPHEIDEAKLKKTLPDFEPTPLEEALRRAVSVEHDLGLDRQPEYPQLDIVNS